MFQRITFKTQKRIQCVSLCQFVLGGTTSFSDHFKLRFNKFSSEKRIYLFRDEVVTFFKKNRIESLCLEPLVKLFIL